MMPGSSFIPRFNKAKTIQKQEELFNSILRYVEDAYRSGLIMKKEKIAENNFKNNSELLRLQMVKA